MQLWLNGPSPSPAPYPNKFSTVVGLHNKVDTRHRSSNLNNSYL